MCPIPKLMNINCTCWQNSGFKVSSTYLIQTQGLILNPPQSLSQKAEWCIRDRMQCLLPQILRCNIISIHFSTFLLAAWLNKDQWSMKIKKNQNHKEKSMRAYSNLICLPFCAISLERVGFAWDLGTQYMWTQNTQSPYRVGFFSSLAESCSINAKVS